MASKLATAAKQLLGLGSARYREAALKLGRFEAFCDRVTTIQGKPFKLEPFQRLILLAYFAGFPEVVILIPKGNGKTTLLAALAVFHLLTTSYPEAYIGASTKGQASKMYEEARRISQLHPAWRKRLIPRQSMKTIYVGKGGTGGSLKVLASDKLDQGSLEGIAPTLGLIDELHAHLNDAIYAAIHGALHKRDGQVLTISTAGVDRESPLGLIRNAALKLPGKIKRDALTVARSAAFVLFEWAVPDGADVEDLDVVLAANPASFVTRASLKAMRASPSMTASRWARYHGNQWLEGGGDWIEPEVYDRAGDPAIVIPGGEVVILGYDHARTYDNAFLVALQVVSSSGEVIPIEEYDPERHEGGRARVIPVTVWKPEDQDGGKVPYWKIKAGIREACQRWTVAGVGFDKLGGFSQSAEELAEEGIPMVEVSMKSNVWAPLTAEMHAAISSRRLEHDADPELRRHVVAAETKETEYGERLHGKPKSKAKVDGAMALGCAWFTAFFTDALLNSDPDTYRIDFV